jgi:ferredoxin like protein
MSVRLEEKLFQNRYLVDEGRPHVCIDAQALAPATLKSLASICPAGCWSVAEDGTAQATLDGCLECGTCRLLAEPGGGIAWNYPRGGYGIVYKFG